MFKLSEGCSCLIVKLRVVFNLYMELGVVAQEGFDWLVNYVLLVSPMSVSYDHLAELSAVVTEVVDSGNIVAHRIVNLVK